ncbi:hypothetical protein JB92DRAFT_2944425 [Gautieria morchelliformis]|nr:hypothetical protein JB92DRAFT_2944425 [Gautieria morchelliformis]
MKYTTFVALIAFVPAAFAVTRVTAADSPLAKRSCVATACSCQGVPNGLFCGDGLFDCIPGHVYQCGDDGKRSCDFGIRNSCEKCGKLQC